VGAIAILQAVAFGVLRVAERDGTRSSEIALHARARIERIAVLAEPDQRRIAGSAWKAEVHASLADLDAAEKELRTQRGLFPAAAAGDDPAAANAIAHFAGDLRTIEGNPGDAVTAQRIETSRSEVLFRLDRALRARTAAFARRNDALVIGIAVGFGLQLIAMALLWLGFIRPAERRIATAFRLLQEQRRQTRSLFDINPAAIAIFDRRGRMIRGNPAALELVGGGGVRWLGRTLESVLDPTSHEDGRAAFAAALNGKNYETEVQIVDAFGARIDVAATVFPHVVEGRILGAIAVAQDIRALKLARAKADEGARRMMALYRIASDRRVDKYEEQIDAALRLLVQRLNLSWAALVRGTENERRVLAIVPQPVEGLPADILVGMETRRIPIVSTEEAPLALHLRSDSEAYARVATDADAEFANLVASLIGTTIERQSHTSKLDRLAFYDGLTGLPNRAMLQLRLESALRERMKFALHYVDLDQFKNVNDAFGHAAGDSVLRTAADRMRECVRRIDTVARLGGDEFMILQPIEHHADAARLAERLVARLGDPFRLEGQPYQIGASVGIALASGGGDDDPELLIRLADTALYEAKRNGKARASFGNMVVPLPREDGAAAHGSAGSNGATTNGLSSNGSNGSASAGSSGFGRSGSPSTGDAVGFGADGPPYRERPPY
jgi:diguanylate cyclase (GGDEF)-like protein/PAS domain S-box-containing protein